MSQQNLPEGPTTPETREELIKHLNAQISINTEDTVIEVPSAQRGQSVEKIAMPEAPTIETSYAEKNPNYYNLANELPSQFCFYDFNTLSAKRLGLQQIAKLSEASEMDDLAGVVDCVSSVIDPDKTALALTPGDFFYLLYWLRIHSFKKAPYQLEFKCTNPDHIARALQGKVSADTLNNEVIINKSSQLTLKYPNTERATEIVNHVQQTYGINLYPANMATFLQTEDYILKLADIELKLNNPRLPAEEKPALEQQKQQLTSEYSLYEYAAYLHPIHGTTLKDRIKFLNSLEADADLLFYIDEFIEACEHGVEEAAKVRCLECNAEVEISVSIDALHFFPKILRNKFA